MKQAQSHTSRYRPTRPWRTGILSSPYDWRQVSQPSAAYETNVHKSATYSFGQIAISILGGVWFIATLPLRLIFWAIAWAGRLTVLLLGFSLMVVGMALWAGPLFVFGIPLFLIGLVLTLRCLD
jgi:hypothetical protein